METQEEQLTKREQFAMAAMQGLLAGVISNDKTLNWLFKAEREGETQQSRLANEALLFADALLEELNKKPEGEL